MRSILLCICMMFASLTLHAESVSGIRLDAGYNLMVVYVDGKQVNLPTSSCFIANLSPGTYLIEVFDANRYVRSKYNYRGTRLYRRNVRYRGNGVVDIQVDGFEAGGSRPYPDVDTPYPDDYYPHGVMNARVFEEFCQTLKKESFTSNKFKIIETAVVNTRFTSEQCMRIVEYFTFESDQVKLMKKIYPVVVDKESFFKVISTLTYSSSKNDVNNFIKEYHERRR